MNCLLDLDARPIIAHRGAAADAPENTLEAFRLAVEQGADALEFDVHLSADGVPVVIHDPTLERTTDRSGPVLALTVRQIQAADAGAQFTADGGRTFPWRGKGVRIPTLAQVVSQFRETPLLIELKTARAQSEVREVLGDAHAQTRCVIASDDSAALVLFREPPWQVGASVGDTARLYFGSLIGLLQLSVRYHLLAIPARYYGLPLPTRRFVTAARRVGCPVHVWTLDDPDTARRLWRNGVNGIITNQPGPMRAAREALIASS
jgi:glycerophosphoryl diester phosphodiesterase